MSLPRRLQIGPNQVARVREKPLPRGQHGLVVFDGENVEIVISSRGAKVDRHRVLFHELIHVAEEKLLLGTSSGSAAARTT
jgi:hypothetical protein